MKLHEVLWQDSNDDPDRATCSRRSEINVAVAAMSMAGPIDIAVEHDIGTDRRNHSIDQHDEERYTLKNIIRKHTKTRTRGLGSALITSTFDHRNRLQQLKACLEEIADELDPASENIQWPWLVTLEDEAWLES